VLYLTVISQGESLSLRVFVQLFPFLVPSRLCSPGLSRKFPPPPVSPPLNALGRHVQDLPRSDLSALFGVPFRHGTFHAFSMTFISSRPLFRCATPPGPYRLWSFVLTLFFSGWGLFPYTLFVKPPLLRQELLAVVCVSGPVGRTRSRLVDIPFFFLTS